MGILRFIFSSFWIWLGFMLLVAMLFDIIYKSYKQILRHRRIMKNGYPPAHCDADGDQIVECDKEEK